MVRIGNVKIEETRAQYDYGKPNRYAAPLVALPHNFHKDMMEKLDDMCCVLSRIADALEEANQRRREDGREQ